MALVRDVHPPDDGEQKLDLRGLLRRFAPRSTVLQDRGPARVRDVAPSRPASVRALWTWAMGRAGHWRSERPAPRAPAQLLPARAPVVLDVGRHAGAALRARPVAPFAISLLAAVLLLLGAQVAVRVSDLQRSTRDRAVAALEESRLGLSALAGADAAEAATHFAAASAALEETEALLRRVSVDSALSALSPAESSAALVRAGVAATGAGESLASALRGARSGDTRAALVGLRDGLAQLHVANELLDEAGPLLPASVRAQVTTVRAQLDAATQRLAPLDRALPTLLAAAGADGPRRYLLVFQNTAERRGTGGFMGSVAIVEFDDLRMTRFDFRDIYSIDWAQKDLQPPPAGLARYYQTMHLRDANYLPDFPAAATWIERGFARSGGSSLDGIVAVDSQVFFDLLEALGPIVLPGTKTPLTREMAFDLITVRIETSKRSPDGPKGVLKDLLPQLGERLQDHARWPQVATVVEHAIAGGHVRAFARDAALEQLATDLGIDGRLPPTDPARDELLLVSTNVGGNKSDRFVTLATDHRTTIDADGSAHVQLTLTKTFTLPESFAPRTAPLLAGLDAKTRDYVRSVLGDGANRDYLRVFVPLGTTVRSVEGLTRADWETHEELGRTVVGLHLTTNVGEIKSVRLQLDLPQRLDLATGATYRFRALKTPGADRLSLTHSLTVAPGLQIVGAPGPTLSMDLSGARDASTAAVVARE